MAARLPYLERGQVGPEVQSVFDTLQKASGRVLNAYRLTAHHARSQLDALAEVETSPHFSALERLVLRYEDGALGTECEFEGGDSEPSTVSRSPR